MSLEKAVEALGGNTIEGVMALAKWSTAIGMVVYLPEEWHRAAILTLRAKDETEPEDAEGVLLRPLKDELFEKMADLLEGYWIQAEEAKKQAKELN